MLTTRVDVYAVLTSGETGGFLGAGALLDRHLVGLLTSPETDSRRDEQSASTQVGERPVGGSAVRCVVVDSGGWEVIEGEGLRTFGKPGFPVTAVRLSAQSSARPVRVQLPPFPATDEANQAAWQRFLATLEPADFTPTGHPRPRRPPQPFSKPTDPGRRPWWCSIWPGAVGCGT